jgi:3-oxoacyl-[acyl-carrier protein] reductase
MNKTLLIVGASSSVARDVMSQLNGKFSRVIGQIREDLPQTPTLNGATFNSVLNPLQTVEDALYFASQIKELCANSLDAILFCASPRIQFKHLAKTTPVELQEHFQIQALIPFTIVRELAPLLARKNGDTSQVVFVLSSVVDGTTPKNMIPYVVGKFAALGLMKALAAELNPKGVRINAISPSMFASPFLKDVPEKILELSEHQHPLKRSCAVSDLTPLILTQLVPESTRFVSGQNWVVTGGI